MKTTRWRVFVAFSAALLLASVAFLGCSPSELRGKSVNSADGKTYLVVDDPNGGKCGPIMVDGRAWSQPLHVAGPIEPGRHRISCGTASPIDFEVKKGTTFHFDYWGP